MRKIRKQIVTDDQNRPVGVLIKYQDWLRLEQALKLTTDHSASLSKLAGTIKLSRDPLKYQQEIRNEWE